MMTQKTGALIFEAGIIIRLQGHPRPLQSNFFMP